MITAYTDIISLSAAKNYLRIDDSLTEDDAFITSCINAAFQWIEKYTNHILKEQASKEYFGGYLDDCSSFTYNVYDYPVVSVVTPTLPEEYTVKTFNTKIKYTTKSESIALQLGYDTVADIPEPLIQAAYSIIQVWYYDSEKTIQSNLIPNSVRFAVNPYRRFPLC